MANAIELHDVTKRFRKTVAVDGLSLEVPTGAIYGFIGPNGSGKTTTLRMILRIYQPDSGGVTVLGQSHGKVADDRVGYLPEERGLYKRMKVYDLLSYYAQLKSVSDYKAQIDYWLRYLGADEWAHKKVDGLSKGMAQKIQFIAAVVHRPQLLVLDEPFTGLDPVNMESLRTAVLQIRDQGTTVVFSTHDMDMAERMCDTIFMIYDGRKVLDGTMDEIQNDYRANRVRVRFTDPTVVMPVHPEITNITSNGRFFDFNINDPQRAQLILAELMQQHDVNYFDVHRPSLHEIFVQIAGPQAKEALQTDAA
jgi:ABC-2 type transport system ATP-binding protein